MASERVLYWGSGSVPCWKPMIVMAELGVDYNRDKLLSFSKKEHKGEEVMELNPRGQLPTFKDGDIVICESNAICDYLEFRYASDQTSLLPKDLTVRAQVLQRMHETVNVMKNVMEGVIYYQFMHKEGERDEKHLDDKKKEAKAELMRWEEYLIKEDPKGGYLVGDTFTMADVYFFPWLAFFVRSKMSMADFPRMKKYYDLIAERPSIKASWPPHWSEGEGTDMFKGM